MSIQLQTHTKAAQQPSFTLVQTGILQRQCACGQHTFAGGVCDQCCQKREQMLQRAAVNAVPPIVNEVFSSSGRPLDAETRAFMEPRFGYDFSQVRVHTDARAAESARAVNALAYTVGQDVVFGKGQYTLGTSEGRRLLAHELTHVVQQGKSNPFGETIYRATNITNSAAASNLNHEQKSTTDQLLAIIEGIERLYSKVNKQLTYEQSETSSAQIDRGEETSELTQQKTQQYLETLASIIPQLRTVANSNDEDLKLRVLAAFSPAMLKRAEMQLTDQVSPMRIDIREQELEKLAAKSIQISNSNDAAEIEADRVASTLISGNDVLVAQVTSDSVMNRQVAEALLGAGTGIFVGLEFSTPAWLSNPPGWVIGAVAAVVGLALLGTGYLLMSQHGPGNVADTGIMDEVVNLITEAKALGRALTVCAALEILMDKYKGNTEKQEKIKATQKAKGCRSSRMSKS